MESPPVFKKNVFYEQKNKYKIVIAYYKTLHILSGLDFGFFEYKSINKRLFWKSMTVLQSVVLCCVCLLILDNQNSFFVIIWIYITIIHYLLTVLGLILFNPNMTFSKLFIDLKHIDNKLQFDSESYNLENKILLANLLHIGFRCIMIVVYYFYSETNLSPFPIAVILLWIITCLHLVHVSYAFVFYSINYRLEKLASVLRTAKSDFSSLQKAYRLIAELTEANKTAFDPVFIVAILSNIPEVMATIYYAVVQLRSDSGVYLGIRYFRLEYVIVAETLLLTFAPAICADKLSAQADRIKHILHDKLMENIDESNVRVIERFIRYVEARGCRFRVCKLIPLNAELLGMVLSFCVTYLIVIIQFTNK